MRGSASKSVLVLAQRELDRATKSEARARAALAAEERRILRERARAHLSMSLRQLSAFDDGLLEVLQTGGIRLLRTDWLLEKPDDFRILRRQDLEALEREGESPLLSVEEAVTLVCRAAREMGVLTYGWLSPGQPDPKGARVAVVRRALRENPHIVAIFWDFASLYQAPRTAEETEIFGKALKVMNEPYASAVGTTVLQLKEIPDRPDDYDGAVAIFGPKDDLNEPKIRAALETAGAIASVEKRAWPPWVIYFASHADALVAIEWFAKTKAELWDNLDTLYNERPYDDRGWCAL